MDATNFTDPRRSLRERETIPIRYAIASEDYRVEHEAITMDRSLHGLRIRTAVRLSCGETVVVLPLGGSQGATPARVVWVHGAESSFEGAAGLEFLNSLPT